MLVIFKAVAGHKPHLDMGNFLSLTQISRAILGWLPALFFAGIIFMFSATPGDEVARSYDNIQKIIQGVYTPVTATIISSDPKIDWLKVSHGISYFCLGFSVLFTLPGRSLWSPGMVLILCSLYSVTDEIHQFFTPGRSASPRDLLIDTLIRLRMWKKRNKPSRKTNASCTDRTGGACLKS
jgi:VanZ family protein